MLLKNKKALAHECAKAFLFLVETDKIALVFAFATLSISYY
jgi:hypothetical protein